MATMGSNRRENWNARWYTSSSVWQSITSAHMVAKVPVRARREPSPINSSPVRFQITCIRVLNWSLLTRAFSIRSKSGEIPASCNNARASSPSRCAPDRDASTKCLETVRVDITWANQQNVAHDKWPEAQCNHLFCRPMAEMANGNDLTGSWPRRQNPAAWCAMVKPLQQTKGARHARPPEYPENTGLQHPVARALRHHDAGGYGRGSAESRSARPGRPGQGDAAL